MSPMVEETRELAKLLGMSDLELLMLARSISGDVALIDLRGLAPVDQWELLTDLQITAAVQRELAAV